MVETPTQSPKQPLEITKKAKFFLIGSIFFVLTAVVLSVVPGGGASSFDLQKSFSPTEVPTQLKSVEATTQAPPHSLTTPPTESPTELLTKKQTESPSTSPTEKYGGVTATYRPGNLTTLQAGLLLSEGLAARLIASSGEVVEYADGSVSKVSFHGNPDGAEVFPDTREENLGGWIYTSNSEMPNKGDGGVGAITFDKDGNILDYKIVLKDTTMNCGGGGTPWNTWVSCEEIEFDGQIYQVDPTGKRDSQVMTLGSDGGRWEAFAYDVRDANNPHFFVTEDHNKGTLRRFTPDNPDWDEPWSMLHGPGEVRFLMIHPTSDSGGTFEWTTNKEAAKNNARSYYPQTEGVDVYGSQLFFVCKRIYQVFTINLDEGTYANTTTVNGLFDGKPDQMQRILDDPNEILYFTEEGAFIRIFDYFEYFVANTLFLL